MKNENFQELNVLSSHRISKLHLVNAKMYGTRHPLTAALCVAALSMSLYLGGCGGDETSTSTASPVAQSGQVAAPGSTISGEPTTPAATVDAPVTANGGGLAVAPNSAHYPSAEINRGRVTADDGVHTH